jgi:hypothetical protein
MKRIARTLASALRRGPAPGAKAHLALPADPSSNVLDLLRRSEAFAEDLGDLVSRRPAVLAKRDMRKLIEGRVPG